MNKPARFTLWARYNVIILFLFVTKSHPRSITVLPQFLKLLQLAVRQLEVEVVEVRMSQKLLTCPPFAGLFVQTFLETANKNEIVISLIF